MSQVKSAATQTFDGI
ncbi:hypothetical protein, partial [Escherichia coli]